MLSLYPLLGLSMLALLAGAMLGMLLKKRGRGIAALKGLMASFIGGLLLLHLLPEAYERVGPLSLLLVLAGFFLMVLPERLLHREQSSRKGNRFFTAEMLWGGLILHQATDGVGLAIASSEMMGDWQLAVVVLAHRIPVAAVVVWLFQRSGESRQAWIRIGCMGLATVAGAIFSDALAPLLSGQIVNMFYALVARSFLHLLTHDFLDHHAHSAHDRRYEFLAFMAGIVLVVLVSGLAPEAHAGDLHTGHEGHDQTVAAGADIGRGFVDALVILVRETAPYLLLGLIISGLLHAYMPASPITWLRRGRPLTQSVKGMIFGLPLPICSCGVLPLFLGLAKRGVPPACLVAFLIATPELGVDSFLLSVKLLGWKFSTVRLIVAAILPVVIALVAVRFLPKEPVVAEPQSCCAKSAAEGEKPESWWHFAFVSLTDDIFPFVFFGLCIAAMAQTLWPVSEFSQWVGDWDIVILGLLGIPFYVCASASVPFALILLQHGFSVGAVVVFLFAGPATNVATILTINKAFGGRSGLVVAAIAFCAAVIMGLAINGLYDPGILDVFQLHEHGWSWLDMAAFAGILILCLMSLYRSGPLHWFSTVAGMIPGVIHHPPDAREACH